MKITESKLKEMVEKEIKNYLGDLRDGSKNNQPLRPLTETSAMHLVNSHAKNGYIIISPCRHDVTPQENKRRIREIIKQIKDSNFSYTPVYGGFIENKGTPNEREVVERSFVIYNYDKEGNPQDIERLYKFGIDLTNEYE